jgi:predicted RNase H-like HicB family nuclease
MSGGQRMEKRFGFTAIYTPIEDGWYMARVLELPEAISQGETLEEAREMLADAVREILELRREEVEREVEGREDVIREPLAF